MGILEDKFYKNEWKKCNKKEKVVLILFLMGMIVISMIYSIWTYSII